ncbi:protein AF-9-like isoform X1 [Cynara cardunculus var. scolymus]|uniref:protein AF-9-like isoform X1 n=1 Tax=Cynara cardunculus var. scolymus TaxID=59895 RepID=UPI000D624DD0|nr:protein AF-9-like isoform X1 [Cynara cardunculus var. scolymus]XP_024971340.1 protein AF-9-like isoform X1 [Cynara cardunculus var. scolymus]
MNLTRKKSPGTYRMESSAPKVLSRYLRGPMGSCHDQCKCVITTQPTEPKTINLFPKRVPKPPEDRRVIDVDHSLNRIKKAPSVVPKAPTRINNVKNNKVVKDEGLKRDVFKFSTKKDVAIEPKSRDLKPKTQVSRTSRRRHSDIFQPIEDKVPPLRVPRRRLSDVGYNASSVRGSRIIKNESRKDSKLPSGMNKKSNSSLKTFVSSPKPVAKVLLPLRSYRSLPKPELKGSKKLKPTKTIGVKVVPEKTLHVIKRTKSQIPISSTSSSSLSSEEKVIACNGLKESCSPLMEDNTPATDGQQDDKIADSEDKNAKEVRTLVVETTESQIPISSASSSSPPSMEDNVPATDGEYNDKPSDSEDKSAIEKTTETERQILPISSASSSSPSMEDNVPATDGEYNDKPSDSEDKSAIEKTTETERQILPISSASSSSPSMEDNVPATDGEYNDKPSDSEDKSAIEETTETERQILPISCEEEVISKEDDTPATDCQNDDTIEDSEERSIKESNRVGKLVVETEDGSLGVGELRFRRGKVVSPQSENSSPRKVQFKQGKELEENESGKGENKSLRRVSSDGVIMSPETSHSINVDLKHQEVVEKKDSSGSLNKVIEETASKLIQTRKSKVKALVGAFENITSGNNLTP